MAKSQTTGYGVGQAKIFLAPKPIPFNRDPVSTDIGYDLGQQLLVASTNSVWELVSVVAGVANWTLLGSGSTGAINSITGDTGGAVLPTLGNVNIVGGDTVTTAGSGDTLTINATAGGYPITPYVVGPAGQAGYQTIQSAITAASGAGGGFVYIQPGTYIENLTLASGVNLIGNGNTGTTITGLHTPPTTGSVQISDLTLTSATHIISSNAAGSANLLISGCVLTVTDGYVYNLANWTGNLLIDDCGANGTNDGVVNNTGGSLVKITDATLGAGTTHSMVTSGSVTLDDSVFNCPINPQTGSSLTVLGCQFNKAVTFSNNSTGTLTHCTFITGASAAITMSSSGSITIDEIFLSSSANPAIAGAGAGTLSIGQITYASNSNISSTLTISYLRQVALTTPYSVGSTGNYSTIQAAITAASAAGGGLVYVQSGTYTESLTLADNVHLLGADLTSTTITGVHTPPSSGNIQISGFTLTSATHILSSAVAGTTNIYITQCVFTVTTGYVFNLASWTGNLLVDDCGSNGTNDGFVNNSGNALVKVTNATIGAGTTQTLTASGTLLIDGSIVNAPSNFVTGASFTNTFSTFNKTITLSNNSTGSFSHCVFSSGASAAITMSSSAAVSLLTSKVTSSNNPAIAGAGAGALTLGDVTFTSNSSLAGTLTVAYATTRLGPSIVNGNITLGTAGNKLISSNVASTTTAGANSFGTVTLAGGTATVATTAVTASSIIFLTRQSVGSTGAAALGSLSIGTITGSTSFVINAWQAANATALQASDVSVIGWMIVN